MILGDDFQGFFHTFLSLLVYYLSEGFRAHLDIFFELILTEITILGG